MPKDATDGQCTEQETGISATSTEPRRGRPRRAFDGTAQQARGDAQQSAPATKKPHARTAGARTQGELRYHAVVETQTELISRFLPDTTLTFVNEANCRSAGKSREELLGTKFLDLLPESEREQVRAAIQSLATHPGVATVEHEIRLPDGSLRWQQWVNRAILNEQGQFIELQGVGRDITERKRMERALQESEARYRDLVESQTEMICRYRPDGTLTFVNAAYCRH